MVSKSPEIKRIMTPMPEIPEARVYKYFAVFLEIEASDISQIIIHSFMLSFPSPTITNTNELPKL